LFRLGRLLLRRIHRIGRKARLNSARSRRWLTALDRAVAATGPAKGRIGLKQTLAAAPQPDGLSSGLPASGHRP
jgi:hypothetical protein